MSRHAAAIEALAVELGLECNPVVFETVPASFIMEIAVYGLPVRMRHWSYGLRYLRQMVMRHMGQSHIFEVMFPGDPCRAYLMDSNSEAENALVTAHVLGHADFARRNALFARFMDMAGGHIIEHSAARARRIERALLHHGQRKVEAVLDAALALETHIDIHAPLQRQRYPGATLPPHPEYDLLWFIAHYAPALQDWERDIFLAVREEAFYFYPVFACQIMNEGWASYWHARLLREAHFLPPGLYLEAIKAHSDVVRPSGAEGRAALQLSAYHLGFVMWEYLIERHGIAGARRICRDEDDFGFIRNHLDQPLADRLQLFVYEEEVDGAAYIGSRSLPEVREAILSPRYNYGAPCIAVREVDAGGGLKLMHDYRRDGRGLALPQAERVLGYIARVWQRPVTLQTSGERGVIHTLRAEPGPP
ncbi:SpoVR family protein [Pseudoduganella sp. LjRoot289]|uniref:SpoVR family protein n=1 Tax=Pseudoduganella sp. LjRoot289 TaxID=3342314 RepID=UPI003ECE839F